MFRDKMNILPGKSNITYRIRGSTEVSKVETVKIFLAVRIAKITPST